MQRDYKRWASGLIKGRILFDVPMRQFHMNGEIFEAEAGLSLQRLVQFSIQKGLTGFEPFFGIPGTVGGGLAMNAGAWGAELKDVLLLMPLMKEKGEGWRGPGSD